MRIELAIGSLLLLGFVRPAFADPCDRLLRSGRAISVRSPRFRQAGDPDDFNAMKRAAAELCRPGASVRKLVYPRGTYYIRQHASDEMARSEELHAVVYAGCRDVEIVGCNASIDVEGNFFRPAVSRLPGDKELADGRVVPFYSTNVAQIIPFYFEHSAGFSVHGFEVNGHADLMTQDPDVFLDETQEYGFDTFDSHDYRLFDMHIHHMGTDAIIIGRGDPPDYNVELDHVTADHVGRSTLSIGTAFDIRISDSTFSNAGNTGGQYGPHSPSAGINVEPECDPKYAPWSSQPCGTIDRMMGNVLIERDRFTENGRGVAAVHPRSTANVTIRRSTFRNLPGDNAVPVWLGVAGGVLEDSTIDAQAGAILPCGDFNEIATVLDPANSAIYATYLATAADDPSSVARGVTRERRGVTTLVRGNQVSGSRTLLACPTAVSYLDIEGNRLTGTHTEPLIGGYGFLMVDVTAVNAWTMHSSFADNQVWIPGAAWPGPAIGAYQGIIYFQGVERLRENVFKTDYSDTTWPIRVEYDSYGHPLAVTNDEFPVYAGPPAGPTIVPVHSDPGYPPFVPYAPPQFDVSSGFFNYP